MDGYISKPIRPEELDGILDQYVTQKTTSSDKTDTTMSQNGSVDIAQLLDRIDDDRALLAELTDIFRTDYPRQLQLAQEAIDANDTVELQRVGHMLKGALSNLSATRGSELAGNLEQIRSMQEIASSQAILNELTVELRTVVQTLDSLCPENAK
jgi:HPt (histidine-containing phosphotransfer) domain-containing protein